MAVLFTTATFADVAIYIGNITGAVSILQSGAHIDQISLSNASGSTSVVTFTDSPTNTTTYIQPQYTNSTRSIVSLAQTYTNFNGFVETHTVSYLTNVIATVTAATNNYTTVAVQSVAAGTTVNLQPNTAFRVGFGLAASATVTNVTAVIYYHPVSR